MKKYENVELDLIPAELIWTDVITSSGEDDDDNSIGGGDIDWD